MKVNKNYVLYYNPFTTVAYFGTKKLNKYISTLELKCYETNRSFVGNVIDCNLTQLKNNLKKLEEANFTILKYK